MIKQQNDGKIYLYVMDPNEAKYQYFVKKDEKIGFEHEGLKAFIEYSINMQDAYKNIEEYNLDRKRKVLIVFDDMNADVISNKKLDQIVTELFIRRRKLNISTVFIRQFYFTVPKDLG